MKKFLKILVVLILIVLIFCLTNNLLMPKYMDSLVAYLQHIHNIERVDFLPFHRLGREKYIKLGIPYPYEDKQDMDKEKCNQLYDYFKERYFK